MSLSVIQNRQKTGAPTYPIASEERYTDGQIIFRQGSWGDWVYVIQCGSVEISRTIGGKKYVLSVLEPGEVLGELGYVGAIKRTATARAIGETTLGIIDRTFLDREFNNLSGYLRAILVTAVKRFRDQIDRSCEFTTRKDDRLKRRISLAFKNRQTFVKAYTGNISRGGLFIRTDRPLKEGEQFLLKLQLPDLSEPINATCEVVWARTQSEGETRPSGMGVKFCEMSKRDIQILTQYVQAIQKGKGKA
jgi:CRP/FNR family cyclic AMP-dependent transcriptional regulator